jgi:hypothetical protein
MADAVVNVEGVTVQVGCASEGLGTTAIDAQYLLGWFSSSYDAHHIVSQALSVRSIWSYGLRCVMAKARRTAQNRILLVHMSVKVFREQSGSIPIHRMVTSKVIRKVWIRRVRMA